MQLRNIRKKLVKHTAKVVSRLYDRPLPPPTNSEKELVEQLKDTFRKLPILETTSCSASEKEWFQNVNRLRELVLTDNPREFLRWHVVSGTMFVKYASYIAPELNYLKKQPDWKSRWSKIIRETHIAHPTPYWRYPQSSGNLIHHAYHLAKFEEKTALTPNSISFVFEFGGGYGSMCRLLHNAGFQGKYVIFDLPAFSALQRFYLESIGITVQSVNSLKTAENGTACISDLEQLRDIIVNDSYADNSTFIATWSISEAPIRLRNSILSLASALNAFLISYQDQFNEIDNIDFFGNWKESQEKVKWYEWEIEHLPNNRYLFGKRENN